ncbi:MAG TPA: prenyltransferase/squalene oxidase repeat-containing protein [Schlesneria sp.]|jgi:hypothetical protein
MFRPPPGIRLRIAAFIGILVISGTRLFAADVAKIDEAVERAKKYLLGQSKSSAAGSLACYSLIKSGIDKEHPDIQRCVREVVGKCRPTGYVPGNHYNYEAGVDAMLLEAADREKYKPQLEMIAQFLIGRQRPHGAWYYQIEIGGAEFGDTSITQYAILGLWAAARADVEIPTETWERAGKWLLMTQRRDGGFGYHPSDPRLAGGGTDVLPTMTVAGTGSLLVIRHVLFRDTAIDEGLRPDVTAAPVSTKRFGVLERMVDDKEKKAKAKAKANATMSAAAFDKAIKEGMNWTGDHFAEPAALASYGNYYFYGIERMGALLDVEKMKTHDWYHEGADELLRRQLKDGSWSDSCGASPATALTILFLTKATAGMINRTPKVRAVVIGGGLLIGGRGLPDNMDAIKVKEGEITKRKVHGAVDGLLAELEKSSGAKVEEAQEAVVEAIQLDNPEQLIGQIERLKRLATDKRVEVRRTAMWALGRTGNITVASYLIRGLSDGDESVAREASVGLCILSRRPNGCGWPTDPVEGLADDVSDDQRAKHLAAWRKESTRGWTEWYMKVRPYDERDDRTQLKPKP